MKIHKKKLVSLVIPCYNEEGNIGKTLDGLIILAKDHTYDFEIIAVNDGSKDATWDVISKYAKKHKIIKGVNQMRNYGQSQAYMAGFNNSKGDYVITVSADLETPLEAINKVIEKLDDGYDFVNTNRKGRWGKERAVKSGLANNIIGKISGVHMADRGSGIKGFTRIIIDNLKLYGEMHRFIPDYVSIYGAKMTEFDVGFKDREFGESAYTKQKRTFRVLLDLSTLAFMLYFARKPFYAMPGRLFGAAGAAIAGMGGVGTVYLLALKVMGQSIGSRPLFIVSVLMVVLGIQSMMIGMLGELMLRIYFESGNKSPHVIREIVG